MQLKELCKQNLQTMTRRSSSERTQLQAASNPIKVTTKENLLREIFHLVNTATRVVIHHSNAGRGLMQGAANAISLDMRQ